jgi:hypothetical protein
LLLFLKTEQCIKNEEGIAEELKENNKIKKCLLMDIETMAWL